MPVSKQRKKHKVKLKQRQTNIEQQKAQYKKMMYERIKLMSEQLRQQNENSSTTENIVVEDTDNISTNTI